MVARGDLGHDSAEAIVLVLGGDHVGGEHAVGLPQHGRTGVVAARLERQDRALAHGEPGLGTSASDPASVAGVRHITSASSPLSW